ncbi:MAG: hypothetical protein OXC28_10780 [Defluviicoccus sp.]|nr:hypothetical protein [Defluviicoccus sp.]
MTRIPALARDEMDDEGKRVYDETVAATGRVGRGPAVGYAHAPGMWETNNSATEYFENRCSLTLPQLRLVALLVARRWNAAYPWAAQARMALEAGLDRAVVDAVNARERPGFANREDEVVHDAARELLATGTLGADGFAAAEEVLGYRRLADLVGVIGHFCKTAMMANVVDAEAPAEWPSHLAD